MKRPLAVFGFATLGWLLALPELAPFWLAALGGALALLLAACLFLRRSPPHGASPIKSRPLWAKRPPLALAVLLAAGLLALGLRGAHGAMALRPVAALAGSEAEAEVRVLETEPGFGEGSVHAVVRVLRLEGEGAPGGFKLRLNSLPETQPGQVLALRLRFYQQGSSAARTRDYAKGYYVAAAPAGEVRALGTSHTLATRLRALQYAASENIRARLPLRLASVAAAMTVGDRRFIPADIAEAYRAAGIGHMLVVSGLHLSLLCGLVQSFLLALLRRRGAAAAGTMLFAGLFALLAGLSPSVLRSALVWLFVLAAPLAGRRADPFTSLGAAILLLLLANPRAAADVGLLLSFSATLGALAGGEAWRALHRRFSAKREAAGAIETSDASAPPLGKPGISARLLARLLTRFITWAAKLIRKLGRAAAAAAVTSLCVSLATLPVLVYAGMSFPLMSLPMNVLLVPLLPFVVFSGFAMALPPALPVLGWPGLVGSVVGGGLLNLFEIIARWCAALRGAVLPLGGAFGLAVVAALYFLALAGRRVRRPLAAALAAVLLLAGAGALHAGLSSGTVSITVAGGGANSSLVVCAGREAAVLYRSRLSAGAVRRVLQANNAHCKLFIDLRREAESTEYEDLFSPARVVLAEDEILAGARYTPFEDESLSIEIARQGGGSVACVDVAGYKVGLCTGSVNLSAYAPLDVLVAGSGRVQGEYALLLAGASAPEWADPTAGLIHADGDALLWLRPGKSAIFREVRNAADG